MSTRVLGLYFQKMPEGTVGRPISHVCVKSAMGFEYPGEEDTIFLTPREFGADIIGRQIDSLIEELQAIKAEAVRKYAAYDRDLQRRIAEAKESKL